MVRKNPIRALWQEEWGLGEMESLIGIDVGGTNLRVEIYSRKEGEELRLEGQSISSLKKKGPSDIAERIAEEIRLLRERNPEVLKGERALFGVAIAGMLDANRARVINAPNLGWKNLDFLEILSRRLGPLAQKIELFNDLEAATWGEYRALRETEVRDVAAVFLGTGLGAGLICGGTLYSGANNTAGEIGHLKIFGREKTGRLCGCGARGCVEAYVGGKHLEELAGELARADRSPFLREELERGNPLGPDKIARGAERGDPACQKLLEETAELLSWAIGELITLFNPELLILGGTVLLRWKALFEQTSRRLREWISTPARDSFQIVRSQLGQWSATRGAALLMIGKNN